jgi:hypothetical protein
MAKPKPSFVPDVLAPDSLVETAIYPKKSKPPPQPVSLGSLSTEKLLTLLQGTRRGGDPMGPHVSADEIKAVLATRPHVPNKREAKAIRQAERVTQYRYLGQCDVLRRNSFANERRWQKMMERKKKVSFSAFLKLTDLAPLLDDGETPRRYLDHLRRKDSATGVYESFWGDKPCLFLQSAGFEFVFTAA